ncbi:MAG: biotin/lipoyl-binding protein, partial [Candidatus Staskawiczbacteria bacterium]
MLSKTKALIFRHKFISGIIIIILIAGIYFGYGAIFNKKAGTTYVTSAVTKGTITTSVSGSGQVSASNTISLQFKASGTLTYLPVQNGQNVTAGQLIAELDTTDAEKTVRDAEANLQSAQLALQKLEGASTLTVPQNKQD